MEVSSKAILSFALCLPLTLQAHRAWMLPSATVLSGTDKWVTVDAAISNDLFYFEHFPMRLEGLTVIAPDGSAASPENASTGRYRSTFDVHLTKDGTYKLAVVNNSVFASYEQGGETKRWRGTADKMKAEIPADATNVKTSKMQTRMELFVTLGKPTNTVLKPTGVGLELAPITHPNDLVAGEAAQFALLLDGKPAPNVAVSLIPGGIRYRDNLKEIKLTTDKDGKFSVTFPDPGMYWMNANVVEGSRSRAAEGGQETAQAARPEGPRPEGARGPGGPGGRGQGGPGGPGGRMPMGNRISYTATLEVMPQ